MSRLRFPPAAAMFLFAVIAISAFIYFTRSPDLASPASSGPPEEGVLATVNGENLTEREMELSNMGNPMAQFMSAEMMLEALIDQRIMLQESTRLGLAPDEAKVTTYMGQLWPKAGEMEDFLNTNQMTQKEVTREIHQHLALTAYREKVETAVVALSPEQMEDQYKMVPELEERVHARHILLLTNADTDTPEQVAMLKEKLSQLKTQAEQGDDFAELAKQYSEDTGSGAQGGDLGWFGRGAMVPPFEQAAFSTPKGAISEIVETQFGLHLIQVLEADQRPTQEFMGKILKIEIDQIRATSEINLFTESAVDPELPEPNDPMRNLTGPSPDPEK